MRTVLAAALLVASQTAQPTFRSEINYVEVDVVVTDAQGNFVTGLTAADFEIADAGKPQTIETFHEINVPIERADRLLYSETAIYPDVATNAAVAEGRVYLIVLDDLHIAPMNVVHVRRRAREFVERYVGSNDLVAVLHTSGRGNVSQDFTSNRSLVLKAIGAFMGSGLQSAAQNKMEDAVQRAASEIADGDIRDRDMRERSVRARNMFMTVRNLAEYMASFQGRRKALLLFSEGMDLDGSAMGDAHVVQDVRTAMYEAIAAATRANVHIYSVDAAGLDSAAPGADVQGSAVAGAVPPAGTSALDMMRERRNAQGTLRSVAEQTGGYAIVNTNNFTDGYTRVMRDSSTYYLLGFYPTTNRDGKFHKLTVRTKRPGLQVRARAGYHAAKPGTAPVASTAATGMAAMLRAAVPTAGLPMSVAVPAFKHTQDEAVVLMAIDLPSEAFRFETAGDISSEDLEIGYQVVDPSAKVHVNSSHRVEMRLKPDTRARIEERGFRVLLPVKVKPGRYQVRVGAESKNAGRRGSVFADLIVPDFFADPIVWSGVSLTSASAAAVSTRPVDDAAKIVPLVPAALRSFPPGDTLALYAEAYVNDRVQAHGVDLTATIRDASGKVVFSTTEQRSTSELGDGPGGFGLRVDVPLKGFAPGSYVLSLTARSRSTGNATATRDIPFAIS
jgi:VWFA-related protein